MSLTAENSSFPAYVLSPSHTIEVRRVTVETADGFMVISRTRTPKSFIPPYRYDYYHDHFDHEADATEFFGEIERGEFGANREVIAMVACRRGVPLGSKKVL